MAEKEVLDLDQLMRVTGVGVYESANRAGIAPSNWSRWRGHGVSPHMGKFAKMRGAVIDLAVEAGKLPDGSRSKPVPELIEIAVRGGVV